MISPRIITSTGALERALRRGKFDKADAIAAVLGYGPSTPVAVATRVYHDVMQKGLRRMKESCEGDIVTAGSAEQFRRGRRIAERYDIPLKDQLRYHEAD